MTFRTRVLFPLFLSLGLLAVLPVGCGGGGGSGSTDEDNSEEEGVVDDGSSGESSSSYLLLAWNDLGMHCMDGKDYSVFSILPPYNNLHAQLIDKTSGGLVSNGVTLTYESVADSSHSINTYSAGKVNFWQYAEPLFGADAGLADDMGLAGFPMASLAPAEMAWNPTFEWFEAEGIPITPYDDAMQKNYYPMVRVAARDSATGEVLATADAVLPVSDEMSCRACHASGTDPDAEPVNGWISDGDPEKEWKRNILQLHDDREGTGLAAQALDGTPVLCASCHGSNALPGTGDPAVSKLTAALHATHAGVTDPASGIVLDDAANRTACYLCHPGQDTRCLRGAMGKAVDGAGKSLMSCQSCHGNISMVADVTREGWLDEPACQGCHFDGRRELTVFEGDGLMREPADRRFATTPDSPAPGFSLYRFSTGHGGLQCEACHGATHAVYPTSEVNDNVLSIQAQGYEGTVKECSACHAQVPRTADGGPHGMHTIGDAWVGGHEDAAERDSGACAYCHGADYRGSFLSTTAVERSFSVEGSTRTFAAGHRFGCYDCHDGPDGD